MVMRHLGLVASIGVVVSCQSTPSVNPHPGNWVVDDFEDRDGEPASHDFAAPVLEHWECRPKDGAHAMAKCEVTADPDPPKDRLGNQVLHLQSTLWPSSDGEFTRSEIATFIDPPQDLTAYKSFSVRAMFIWQEIQPLVKFQLSCGRARTTDGGISPLPSILRQLEGVLPPTAKVYPVELAGFAAPGALDDDQKVVRKDCLAQVDGIKITVDSQSMVPPDQTWTFDLYVDDIQFIP